MQKLYFFFIHNKFRETLQNYTFILLSVFIFLNLSCSDEKKDKTWWESLFSLNPKENVIGDAGNYDDYDEFDEQNPFYISHFYWDYEGKWHAVWKIPKLYVNDAIWEITKLEMEDIQKRKNKDNNFEPKKYWQNIYHKIYQLNKDRMDNIVETFRKIKDRYKMSDREIILFILAFIQGIDYMVPGNYFGLVPPPLILASSKGDCDSKALLLITILKKLNYDAILFHSIIYKHAMVGVWFYGSGKYIEFRGKKYYFCETTQTGWLLGQLPPDVDDVNNWYPIEID